MRAAQLFGISQPHVSELKNSPRELSPSGRCASTLLDRDVEIVIRPKAKRHDRVVSVSVT